MSEALMRVFASPLQRLHDPERELESSGFQVPLERPHRAVVILAALAADGRFDIAEPADWGMAPIEAVCGRTRISSSHWAGIVSFLDLVVESPANGTVDNQTAWWDGGQPESGLVAAIEKVAAARSP